MPSRPASYEQRRAAKSPEAIRQAIARAKRGARMQIEEQSSIQALRSSGRWQALRRMVLRRGPLCADPWGHHAEDGRAVPADEVHHVRPAVQDPGLFFDPGNLTGLCSACHAKISALERAGRPVPYCRRIPPIDV